MRRTIVLDADDPRLPALLERQRRRRRRRKIGRIVTAIGACLVAAPIAMAYASFGSNPDPGAGTGFTIVLGVFWVPGIPTLLAGVVMWGW